ncbi:MAG: hypothetical protein IPM82_06640 [Saprospiraceae bacterium]|nr:hypothetical protein [Saprospiraceae bacterium]
MKKSIKFRFVIMFSLLSAALLLAIELVAQSENNSSFEQKTGAKINNLFDYNIISSFCYADGLSLGVNIAYPKKYTYLWEINGGPGGHNITVDCVCGSYAKIRVMRLSDGLQVSKIIFLPKCKEAGAN